MTSINYIQKGLPIEDVSIKERVGIAGYSLLELAALNIPVTPGFIIDISNILDLPRESVKKNLDEGIQKLEDMTGRRLTDLQSPLLLNVCLSPSMIVENTPVIRHIGLNTAIVQSLGEFFKGESVYNTFLSFIETYTTLCLDASTANLGSEKKVMSQDDAKAECERLLSTSASEFPQNPSDQLESAVYSMAKSYHADPMNRDIPAAVVIQYIPHGDSDQKLINGHFLTRDVKTGEPQLNGGFSPGVFLSEGEAEQDINELDNYLLDELDLIAGTLEGYFLDVRHVDFVIEQGNVYVIRNREPKQKSMITKLRILADLKSDDQISDEEYVTSISPNELNSLLYSTINVQSVSGLTSIHGGIAGSLGATCGKVYFSTKKLIDAYWKAKAEDGDTNLILIKKSTFAEDVQAVEIGCGVVSSEGGYTSHAPIVARSLGKPATVFPDITYHEDHVIIGGHKVNEGDYLSMEISSAEEPAIYLGKATLEYPDIEKSGVKDLLIKAKKFNMGVKILANADTPQEAAQAKLLGADGIGLCRTEHMFHRGKRIYDFRDLLIAKNSERKKDIHAKIKAFLTEDFEEIFEIMDGMPITIRLLDAPMHEFLPTDETELDETVKHLPELSAELSKEEMRQSFLRLKETNPMLGHRGCRVGISSPEIYDLQTAAILAAALKVKQDKNIDVQPGIMIPLIMSKEEMYLIKNGQIMEGKESVKGIIGVIRQFMKENELKRQPFEVKIGAMIELPAAAISAADIAKQSEFFSFGTNDLTQTTMGLSRDDINSFLPAYTEMDVWKNDPFQNLLDPVKILIDRAIQSGRQVRPDLKIGICGEHGANPEVIEYCLNIGMNYISCSPFGIPIAILAVAQTNLANR